MEFNFSIIGGIIINKLQSNHNFMCR